jgi:heme/copper-type cytochrome/quinol oxidase subunit 2
VQLYQTILEVIDMRSFSNLWFWIILAVFWSGVSHFVLGVPYDMVIRARRHGGEAEQDLADLVRIGINRILNIVDTAGVFIIAFSMFSLSILATLAVVYRIEFAQALLSLYFPLLIVAMLSVRTARRIRAEQPEGPVLHRRLLMHRLTIQILGIVSILITSMWGMWMNLQVGSL